MATDENVAKDVTAIAMEALLVGKHVKLWSSVMTEEIVATGVRFASGGNLIMIDAATAPDKRRTIYVPKHSLVAVQVLENL